MITTQYFHPRLVNLNLREDMLRTKTLLIMTITLIKEDIVRKVKVNHKYT